MVKKILLWFIVVCVWSVLYIFLLLGFRWYIKSVPDATTTVKFSVSQQKVVAVENFKGENLPLSPLPNRYEKIYVE
ncbi:MAG: hypothetical protein AAB456_00450 [Patescibacteria group bacterium]